MAGLDDIRGMAEGAIAGIKPEDVAAGAELAAEAASGAIDKLSESVANMNPENLAAGADLIKEAVSNVVQKKAE